MPDLIGSREAARILGVCRGTVWNWAAKGKLTTLNGRGYRMFDRAEVEALRRVDEATWVPDRPLVEERTNTKPLGRQAAAATPVPSASALAPPWCGPVRGPVRRGIDLIDTNEL